jgi:hypothetical protein
MQILMFVHIGLMAIAAVLIGVGATIAHGRNQNWLKRHKIFVLSGVISALAGFFVMFVFKMVTQFPHFQSLHAIAGIIGVLFLIVTPIIGFNIAHGPKFFRPMHRLLGRITGIVVLLAAIMGIFRLVQLFKQ